MVMHLPSQVSVIEVAPRDGFQVESTPISTAFKVATINALSAAGFRQIQVTSFVHPKWVPQMADAEAVCGEIERHPDVTYSALALNPRGVERAQAAGITTVDLSISVSETHSKKNVNATVSEAMSNLKIMVDLAHLAKKEARVGLQCVVGCAYEGTIPERRVLDLAEEIVSWDIDMFFVADTTGMANPLQVKQLLGQLRPMLGDVPVIVHLHDTRGAGLANMVAALECGVTHFDTALGGLGGCPFVPGAAGNLATEDVLNLLHAMGIETGIDIAQAARHSCRLEEVLGRRLPGKMHRLAGR